MVIDNCVEAKITNNSLGELSIGSGTCQNILNNLELLMNDKFRDELTNLYST